MTDQFKDSNVFLQHLNDLEKYSEKNTDNLARMSLFTQFDPLVAQVNKDAQNDPPPSHNNNPSHQHEFATINESMEDEQINRSGMLINVNTPAKPVNGANGIHCANGMVPDNSSPSDDASYQEPDPSANHVSTLQTLIGQLALFNQKTVDIAVEQVENHRAEIAKLTAINTQLAEDMNGVEKSYYDIHSRYDSLRSIVKDMDNRESEREVMIAQLSEKLNEKENENHHLRSSLEKYVGLFILN